MSNTVYISYRPHVRVIPIFEITTLSASNQPTGGVAKVVSDNAGDTQKITIWGTRTNQGTQIFAEELTLNGVSAVTSTTTDWQKIYGAFLGTETGIMSARATGSITVTNTGGSVIYTIATTKLSIGCPYFNLRGQNIEIENIAGNTWFNLVLPVTPTSPRYVEPATTTGACVQMTGRMSKLTKTMNNVSFISDGSGSTVQITVFEE